jgi:hypothetical protein
MDTETSELLATKTILVLFEKNSTDLTLERVKSLLNLLIIEKKVPNQEIAVAVVRGEAVLLKSQKIAEKGFPLVYLIQKRKFVVKFTFFSTFAMCDLSNVSEGLSRTGSIQFSGSIL